ncbi:hypothetical protein K4L06_15455 [Lysobacter sp. BMK333-48F3]|uniref:hypothetical protein n=1 Tax=Lysobacter sp. BMK333-48F3 TaxID=2867962 RepID=UPI001C8CEB1C|nr:hypothetical protein [Lysobacter sp. BMK333-48F3]MBX9402705.1 hypothetical protein [Lysobacter sp. BMK333-48F3]
MARLIAKIHFDTRTLCCAILCLGLVAGGSPAEVLVTAPQPGRSDQPASLSSPKAQRAKDTPNASASAPKLSSAEFEEKLFALIHGTLAPDDLSKARVEELTHFPLGASGVEGTWSMQGSLDSGSAYSFDFSQYTSDDKRVGIRLPDEKQYDPQRRRTCALALAGLHDKLNAMDYQYSEFPGPHNRPQAWHYWKGRQSLLVDYTHQQSPEGDQTACVHAVTIEMIIED